MDWKEAFNNGVPLGMLMFLCFGLWRLVLWAKAKVVEPIVESHLKLIKTLTDAVPSLERKQDESMDVQAKVAGKQAKQMSQLRESLDNQTDVLQQAIEYQSRLIEDNAIKNGCRFPVDPPAKP